MADCLVNFGVHSLNTIVTIMQSVFVASDVLLRGDHLPYVSFLGSIASKPISCIRFSNHYRHSTSPNTVCANMDVESVLSAPPVEGESVGLLKTPNELTGEQLREAETVCAANPLRFRSC